MRLIDADALIAQMKADAEQMEDPIAKMFTYAAINDVKHAPTIEPEQEDGEWIYGEHDVAMCDGYWCNKCGFFVPWDYRHKSIDYIKDYHFCPNCGVQMENDGGEPGMGRTND